MIIYCSMYPLEGGLEAAQETLNKSYVEKN